MHPSPKELYQDYWDLMRRFDVEQPSGTDGNAAGLLGEMAAQFYVGVIAKLGNNDEGQIIALELATRFVDMLCSTLSVGGDNNEGKN